MTKAPALRSCPFCGGHNLQVHSIHLRVECIDCYAEGPEAVRKTEAINAWNTRPESDGERILIRCLASLAAAISLLERTPKAKKAAPSDKMFEQMLTDYRAALEAGRAAIRAQAAAERGK